MNDTQDTIERWYLNTTPSSGSRSKDAHMRERLSRKTGRIDESVETALWDTRIETKTITGADIGNNVEGTMRILSTCAGESIVEALIEEMGEDGLVTSTEEVARANKAWSPCANAYAREWLEDEAPATHWDALVRTLREVQPDICDGALTMTRLIDLARIGPELTQRMKRIQPWIAREAWWKLPIGTIEKDEQMWEIRAVQLQARMLVRNDEVSDEDAERALKHWRWPIMRPPLEIVAAGAGRLAPLRSDSAWANAMSTETQRIENDVNKDWVDERRKGEETTQHQVIAEITKIASRIVDADKVKNAAKILERCQRAWSDDNNLEGNGDIEKPQLVPITEGEETHMMWMFKITGPEVLLAGCVLEGVPIWSVLEPQEDRKNEETEETPLRETALVVTIEKGRRYGRFVDMDGHKAIEHETNKSTIRKTLRKMTAVWTSEREAKNTQAET